MLPRVVLVTHEYFLSLFSKFLDSYLGVPLKDTQQIVGKKALVDCPLIEPYNILNVLIVHFQTQYATESLFSAVLLKLKNGMA